MKQFERGFFLLLVVLFTGTVAEAQFSLKRQIPPKLTFEAADVIDSVYGIQMYEALNMMLRGDSIRMCGTYACQQWVEDFYTNGQLLHKGFYIDGQLNVYKNYYPDGTLEREFKSIDNYRATVKLYYPSGKIKSEVRYNDGVPESWIDYNENGVIVFKELMDKSLEFLQMQNYYFDNGSPMKILELKDKKKLTYTYAEYYPSGKIKVEGMKIFDTSRFEYVTHGTWKYFDESGGVTKTEEYAKGEKVK